MTSQDDKSELCRIASAESCVAGLHVTSPPPSSASLASLASHVSVHSLNASSGDDENAEEEGKKQEEEKEVFATKSGAGVHDDDMDDYFLFWN